MCFNISFKLETRISTNPAGLADFLLHPLCCRLLQSSSIHPPFPFARCVCHGTQSDCPQQEDAAIQTPSHTLLQALPSAGRTHPGLTSCQALPPHRLEQAASPQALGGQGRSRAQGWAGSRGVLPGSWELSCARTTRM